LVADQVQEFRKILLAGFSVAAEPHIQQPPVPAVGTVRHASHSARPLPRFFLPATCRLSAAPATCPRLPRKARLRCAGSGPGSLGGVEGCAWLTCEPGHLVESC